MDALSTTLPFPEVAKPRKQWGNPLLGQSRKWKGARFCGINAELPGALFNDYDPQQLRQSEKPEHRRIVTLKEQGYENKEIAEALGVSRNQVSQIVRQPWARQHMIETMQKDVSQEIKNFLEGEVLGSLKVIRDIRDDANATRMEKLKAAEMLADRTLGKPTQPFSVPHAGKPVSQMTDAELDAAIAAGGAFNSATNGAPRSEASADDKEQPDRVVS